jgi:hypothetical protein
LQLFLPFSPFLTRRKKWKGAIQKKKHIAIQGGSIERNLFHVWVKNLRISESQERPGSLLRLPKPWPTYTTEGQSEKRKKNLGIPQPIH